MEALQHLFTNRIQDLINEAEALAPGHSIIFETMSDTTTLQRSAGAATVVDTTGQEIIYLDPSRADEYMLAHEIMHIILHRSGWPQMLYMLPNLGVETIERRIADNVDNIFDHYIFNRRLESLGFDATPYREWFVSMIDGWPSEKIQGPSVLINALHALDGLLLGSPYRERVARIVRQRQPHIFAIAQRMEERVLKTREPNKVDIRRAMVTLLDLLGRWITQQTGHQPDLRKQIGILPLFTDEDGQKRASEMINIISQPFVVNGRALWLIALELKADNTCYYTHCLTDKTTEPPEVSMIRHEWQSQDLRTFMSTLRARWGKSS